MDQFVEIEFKNDQDSELLEMLRNRIPLSTHIYNIVKFQPRFPNALKIFSLGNEINKDSWILTVFERKDYGQDVNISAPGNLSNIEEFKSALLRFDGINWGSYSFAALDSEVFQIIVEIIKKKRQAVEVHKCNFYQMGIKEASEIEIDKFDEGSFELKKLEIGTGPTFLSGNWAFSREGTLEFFETLVINNESVGLYENGNDPVSGVILANNGMIGLLFTRIHYRKKGFGKLVCKSLMKQLGLNGFYPTSAVAISNEPSNVLHTKLGFYKTHDVYFIIRTTIK